MFQFIKNVHLKTLILLKFAQIYYHIKVISFFKLTGLIFFL